MKIWLVMSVVGSSPLAREIRRPGRFPTHPRPVHPRSRGKYRARDAIPAHLFGSSPLAREIRAAAGGQPACRRFIPARAGNTRTARIRRPARPVHPRSRGKYGRAGFRIRDRRGSSPLAREILPALIPRPGWRRFIPARAGNTPLATRCKAATTVHPRSRGKYAENIGQGRPVYGSSPLAREIRIGVVENPRHRRFIPARAGNTAALHARIDAGQVHPRSRGKYVAKYIAKGIDDGSSPLAREIRQMRRLRRRARRFIPARAGNTVLRQPRQRLLPVHPRSRGKYEGVTAYAAQRVGSSPLAREIRKPRTTPSGLPWFIPARAGNTRKIMRMRIARSVHPRSRGKYGLPVAEL